MSVHFISGKPGGGKSLYGMKLVMDELRFGSREIYTNLPIDLGRMAEYCRAEGFIKDGVHITDRIRVLTDDEAAFFWTYRPGVKIERLTDEDWRAKRRPDYSVVTDAGVMFVIDEIHNFFNARSWAETGRDVLFYLSQHRKLGDTVICITQAIGNVDKQFRSVSQDYTYLRNVGKERMGLFKLPAIFVRQTYTSPATDTSKPMESGTFKLDVSGLASCYNTGAGVGIHGRKADTTERRKGIHWLVIVIALPVILFGIGKFAPQWLGSFWTPKKAKASQVTPTVTTNQVMDFSRPLRSIDGVNMPTSGKGVGAEKEKEIFVTGYVRLKGKWNVYLSDGSVVREGLGELEKIDEAGVTIRGRRYRMARLANDEVKSNLR